MQKHRLTYRATDEAYKTYKSYRVPHLVPEMVWLQRTQISLPDTRKKKKERNMARI